MTFKKLDNHTLALLVIGALVLLASIGLAAWLYKTSPTATQQPQPETTVIQGKAITPEQAMALGLPSAMNNKTAGLKPMPKAWDDAIDAINPDGRPVEKASKTLETIEPPQYVKNAEVGVVSLEKRPKIAIVIDDVGVHSALSRKADKVLPPEVTFSFLPYGSATMELAKKARKEGREVMIHLPMEPMPRLDEPPIDPGPNALYVDLEPEEMRKRTRINLKNLKDMSVGVNNHMGSRFTSNLDGMKVVLPLIEEAGLFFMDSVTTNKSAVEDAAKAVTPNMPLLKRDIFLDHYITEKALRDALQKLEQEAKATGRAIAIGHPHSRTLSVLQDWLPTLPFKGIDLVPITHMLATDEVDFMPTPPALPEGVAAKNLPQATGDLSQAPEQQKQTTQPLEEQPEPMHTLNPEENNGSTGLY